MVYHYKVGVLTTLWDEYPKRTMLILSALILTTFGLLGMRARAATSINGCTFDDSVPNVWSLSGNCSSTAQIDLPAGLTLEGNGYTVSPIFAKTDNSNNSVFGIIDKDGVTINDLKIDGSGGTNLHGIHVYTSNGVNINNAIILDNDRSGLVVNGSNVTVDTITTGGNGWHGINVDQGSGVIDPSVLTVNGTSVHTDLAHIYVDDVTKNVAVNDTLSQYKTSDAGPLRPNDLLYTLKVVLHSKEECKANGWKTSDVPLFKNQGDCVSYFASNMRNQASGEPSI